MCRRASDVLRRALRPAVPGLPARLRARRAVRARALAGGGPVALGKAAIVATAASCSCRRGRRPSRGSGIRRAGPPRWSPRSTGVPVPCRAPRAPVAPRPRLFVLGALGVEPRVPAPLPRARVRTAGQPGRAHVGGAFLARGAEVPSRGARRRVRLRGRAGTAPPPRARPRAGRRCRRRCRPRRRRGAPRVGRRTIRAPANGLAIPLFAVAILGLAPGPAERRSSSPHPRRRRSATRASLSTRCRSRSGSGRGGSSPRIRVRRQRGVRGGVHRVRHRGVRGRLALVRAPRAPRAAGAARRPAARPGGASVPPLAPAERR